MSAGTSPSGFMTQSMSQRPSALLDEQYGRAMDILNKGMELEFENAVKLRPKQYQSILDKIDKKFPQNKEIFGKPNVVINTQEKNHNKKYLIDKALNSYTVQEIIKMAE